MGQRDGIDLALVADIDAATTGDSRVCLIVGGAGIFTKLRGGAARRGVGVAYLET